MELTTRSPAVLPTSATVAFVPCPPGLRDPLAGRHLGPRRAGALATGAGRALHRCRALLRVGSLGLSPAQGPRPDHQPGLHHDEGRGRVQEQDDCAEPALADRLHLPEGRLGWGWFYLSTILDDFSRYIIAWKLCTTMKAEDVTDTVEAGSAGFRVGSGYGDASTSSAIGQRVELRLRRPGQMARAAGHATYAWCALSSDDAGKNRALASNAQEPHPARELLSARRSRSSDRCIRRVLQSPALSREHLDRRGFRGVRLPLFLCGGSERLDHCGGRFNGLCWTILALGRVHQSGPETGELKLMSRHAEGRAEQASHVASRLRLRRLEAGLTQTSWRRARRFVPAIAEMRRGHQSLSAGALYQLALTLDVPVQYFFDGLSRRDKKRG